MKNLLFLSTVSLFLAASISACNNGSGGSPVTAAGTCPTGQVNTAYGCLQQCPNSPGMGLMANGQCTAAVAANTCTAGQVNTINGCLPQCPNNPTMGMLNGQCTAMAITPGMNGYGGYGNQYGTNPYNPYGNMNGYGNQYGNGYQSYYYGNPYMYYYPTSSRGWWW